LEQSEESPVPVRVVSKALADYIGRLGQIWVEGQLSEIRRRPGAKQTFLRLRDMQTQVSLSLVAPAALVEEIVPPLAEGARVVVLAGVEFWSGRGDLHLRARRIRAVGLGELLARLEQLKATLAAEGVFDAERKRPLPFLPNRIGLICGRNSEAERDVIHNAERRWPAITFELREVAVQGTAAAAAVTAAVRELDAMDEVEVIVITRGGGSVEDLLPFSDEGLIRAVAATTTPVVSAIGHERDTPLLDLVADVRASTPTDAARRVVPDLAAEEWRIADLTTRLGTRTRHLLAAAGQHLAVLRQSRELADPGGAVADRAGRVEALRLDAGRALVSILTGASSSIEGARGRLHALSPAATLERGYAIVVTDSGVIARNEADVTDGARVRIRLAHGELHARRIPAVVDTKHGPAL
jgi:exodeoxyribonuclease VII large subunit